MGRVRPVQAQRQLPKARAMNRLFTPYLVFKMTVPVMIGWKTQLLLFSELWQIFQMIGFYATGAVAHLIFETNLLK
jgi:hypothetical protein